MPRQSDRCDHDHTGKKKKRPGYAYDLKLSILYFGVVVDLVFEESLYEVSEAIANESLHLALQVCVTHGNNRSPMCGRIGIEFVSFNGTAKGKK